MGKISQYVGSDSNSPIAKIAIAFRTMFRVGVTRDEHYRHRLGSMANPVGTSRSLTHSLTD